MCVRVLVRCVRACVAFVRVRACVFAAWCHVLMHTRASSSRRSLTWCESLHWPVSLQHVVAYTKATDDKESTATGTARSTELQDWAHHLEISTASLISTICCASNVMLSLALVEILW